MASDLQLISLTKSFGDLVLFDGISFSLESGRKVALVARNGAGKTTLLRIIAADEEYDSGEVVTPRGLRIGYLRQEPHFDPGMSVAQACLSDDDPLTSLIRQYEAASATDSREVEHLSVRMDEMDGWGRLQRMREMLSRLGLDDPKVPIGTLSGGQVKRVALAAVLSRDTDMLILDEPTNHLDSDMTRWLEEYLRSYTGSVLMVTHDRYFLDNVCNGIVELDGLGATTYDGNYTYYLEKKREQQQAAAARLENDKNIYRRELEWMRRQPQARATKAKYRIDAFYELKDRVRNTNSPGNVRIDAKAGYIGKKIFEVRDLSKSYDGRALIKDFSYTFSRYEKLGIVGANGSGKTTFLRMVMGLELPDSGTIDIGETVRFGYYDQGGMDFDDTQRVIDAVTDIAETVKLGDGRVVTASQFLTYFLFPPPVQRSFISRLSGGERRRLYLCTILMREPNFLVLDEPTNDLDILTIGVLEEYLSSFGGCLLVVSHDRYFMDKVVDNLLVFAGDGTIKGFAGSFSDYMEWKAQGPVDVPSREGQKEKPAQQVKSRPVRLSYKEEKELGSLEAEIALLEQQKEELTTLLSGGGLDHEALGETSSRITALMERIDLLTERWMELSEKNLS